MENDPLALFFCVKTAGNCDNSSCYPNLVCQFCSHEECERFRAIPVRSRARLFCPSLHKPLWNSNICYYFRISAVVLKIPQMNPWSQKIWIKLTRLWIVLHCHTSCGLMMGFSSSPSKSLILNSGEKIVHVKIVSFSSENSLLENSRIFISSTFKSFYGGNLSLIKTFDFPNFRASLLSTQHVLFLQTKRIIPLWLIYAC